MILFCVGSVETILPIGGHFAMPTHEALRRLLEGF
jgi:hypothetical protein